MTITEVEFNLSLKQALDENNVTLKIVKTPYNKTVSFIYNKMRYLCRVDFNSNNELKMQSIEYFKEDFLNVEELIPKHSEPLCPDYPMERNGYNQVTLDFDINAFNSEIPKKEKVKNDTLTYYKTISNLNALVNPIIRINKNYE
jgi:hypothetical protein